MSDLVAKIQAQGIDEKNNEVGVKSRIGEGRTDRPQQGPQRLHPARFGPRGSR